MARTLPRKGSAALGQPTTDKPGTTLPPIRGLRSCTILAQPVSGPTKSCPVSKSEAVSKLPTPMFDSPTAAIRRIVTATVATGLLVTCLPAQTAAAEQGKPLSADRQQGAAAVSVENCKTWLYKLASEEFGGRGTGQAGYGKAANYVADHFKSLGLEARGENGSYFQNMPWSQTKVSKAELVFQQDGDTVLAVPKERMIGSASTKTDANGKVVLLNLELPEMKGRRMPSIEGLDEYDFEGKIVIVAARGSRRSLQLAPFMLRSALQGQKVAAMIMAQEKPAKGGISGSSRMGRSGRNPAASARGRRPASITIGGKDVEQLLAFGDLTHEKLAEGAKVTELPLTARLSLECENTSAPAMNVWAVLPGSDPQLKDEYVVIGSHLDHLGRRGGNYYPGADDDGSGTTGVMAAAQMFAKNNVRPKRSILFVCFSGEERGLLGSRYFAQNCPIPLSSIAAELQMDMIGRSEEESRDGGRLVNKGETAEDNRNVIHLVGTQKMSRGLHETCMAGNDRAGFDIEFDQESLFTRSDHANFAFAGVPVAFVFTGIHKDYHQTTDTPDKIEYPKLLRVARYIYDIGFQIGNDDTRPTVDEDLWKAFKKTDRRGRMPKSPAAPMTGGK